jgi:hypothetical protein
MESGRRSGGATGASHAPGGAERPDFLGMVLVYAAMQH